jgi:vanillate O-demethylase monooxygenase subunit
LTLPTPDRIARYRAAMASMAGRDTPLIHEEWYCAGFVAEFGRTLTGRRLLGRDLVFYRTTDGELVALEDRCAHRSFPLSAGRLVGDEIVCAYHGFCYDRRGDCVRVPSQPRAPKVGVRHYPIREIGRIAWIWMGDPERAASRPPPAQPWMSDPGWESCTGYLHLAANYVALHENLLDLTHIEYLHAATLGANSPGFAATPFGTRIEGDSIAIWRRVEPTGLPPVIARTTGLGAIGTAARVSRTDYLSPALEQLSASYFDGSLPEGGRAEFSLRTAHLVTPESLTTTHYFVDHAWNWGQGQPELAAMMHDGLFAAFAEDVKGLGLVEATLAAHAGSADHFEISVAADAAAVAMRRHLLERSAAERASVVTLPQQARPERSG